MMGAEGGEEGRKAAESRGEGKGRKVTGREQEESEEK